MRSTWFAAALVLAVATGFLVAQQPPTAPPVDPLDQVLGQWEKAMTGVQSLTAHCTRTSIDKTYQTTEVFEGQAKFLKGPAGQSSRASLEMFKKNRPEVFEKYVCTGTFLYEFAPQSKVIRIHELPPPKNGQVSDDNFLSFLFGMKAAEAKSRYKITYVPAPAADQWYQYIRIHPLQPSDKADFSEARLVLSKQNYLPRQLWFQQPNGNEVSWDFPKMDTKTELRATDFGQPALPPGWQFQRVPRETQARIIRQND